MNDSTNNKWSAQLDKLLQMHVAEKYPESLLHPFRYDGKTYATNGYTFIIIPCTIDEHPEHDRMIKVLPQKYTATDTTISIAALKHTLSHIERVAETKIEDIISKCPDCGGDGKVVYTYDSRTTHTWYDLEADCPICDGEGKYVSDFTEVPTGKMVYASRHLVHIGNSFFNPIYIEILIQTAELLFDEEVTLIHQNAPIEVSIFGLGKGIEVGIMPIRTERIEIGKETIVGAPSGGTYTIYEVEHIKGTEQ